MFFQNCRCKCGCTLWVLIAGLVLGVVAAFAQITGVLIPVPANLTAALIIGLAALGIVLIVNALAGRSAGGRCKCTALDALSAGILGTIGLAALALLVGITATSVFSALLTGALVFSFVLMVGAAVCYLRAIAGCDSPCPYTED